MDDHSEHLEAATADHARHRDRVVSGPIIRTIFTLAAPVVLGMLMEFALSVTDFFWVGKLGATAQDAITSSMVVIWTVFAMLAMVGIGITALVSRHVGANDLPTASFYIRQSLVFAVILSLLISIAGFTLAPALFRFMGAGPETMAHATPYIRIFFVTTVFFALADTCYAIFRASGDTRTPMIVSAIVVMINMILDPLLILGIGPFPHLGVPGASIATGIAIFAGAVIIAVHLLQGKLGYRVEQIWNLRPDFKAIFKMARIGLPIASHNFVFVVVYWFLIRIVHEYGEAAGAAMGIGNRMESLSYLTCFGFSLAASTMVGQNLGAEKPDRAARCAWGATGLAVALTLINSALFLAIPSTIAGVFTDNPQVLAIARDYLIILGLSQVTMAIEIVLEGAFSGAGDTMPPMIVMLPGAVARIPLAYFLCFELDWGVSGVWWTLTITTTVKALVLAGWFKLGRWKLKKV